LGLGLYIASQIARAHGGTLAVDSTNAATAFTAAQWRVFNRGAAGALPDSPSPIPAKGRDGDEPMLPDKQYRSFSETSSGGRKRNDLRAGVRAETDSY
jgi:signal transduction histidine kinase